MVLVQVACGYLGRGTKVHSPEDPVAQKERAREEERQKNVPGTAETGARHREYSTGHHALVPRASLHRGRSARRFDRPRHTQQSEREDDRAGEPHCEQHPLEQAPPRVERRAGHSHEAAARQQQ